MVITKKISETLTLILAAITLFCGYTCNSSKDDKTSQNTDIMSEEDQAVILSNKLKEPHLIGDTYYDVEDLIYFQKETGIVSLKIWKGNFSDLSPLAKLTQLEELEIQRNDNITDISPLSKLTKLKRLDLFCCENINSIQPLSGLVNLQYLDITRCLDQTTDCSELVNLQNLETLWINIGKVTSLTYISQLRNLQELHIDISYLRDDSITALKNLTQLRRLEVFGVSFPDQVTGDNIKPLDLAWVEELKNLEYIRFDGFDIADVSPLAKLPNLTDINTRESNVRDYTPLLKSKSLKTIVTPVNDSGIENRKLFEERGIVIGDWSDH